MISNPAENKEVHIEQNNVEKVSNSSKLIILFLDHGLFALIFLAVENVLYSQLDFPRVHPWALRILIYFLFFTLSEFFFNGSLGMKFLKVSIVNREKGKLDGAFIKYSFLIILDRLIFLLLIYFFRVFFHSQANLLISEKYSGLRWSRNYNKRKDTKE